MTDSRHRAQGIAALGGAAVIWGSTYVVSKGALDDIGPLTLALVRFLVVLPLLLPVAVRAGLRPEHLRQRRFWVFGATGVTVYYGLQNVGIALTTAGSAALVTAAIPGATAILAFLVLGERPSAQRWTGIALSTVGVALIVGSGLDLGAWQAVAGNLIVLASTVAWAGYTVQGRRLGAAYAPIVSTTACFVTGTALLVPLAGAEIAVSGWPTLSWSSAAAVVYLGLFGSGLAMVLWNVGVGRMEASAAGAFTNVVPVVGLAFAVGFGEAVSWLQLVGGTIAGIGIVIAQRQPRRGAEPAARAAVGVGPPSPPR